MENHFFWIIKASCVCYCSCFDFILESQMIKVTFIDMLGLLSIVMLYYGNFNRKTKRSCQESHRTATQKATNLIKKKVMFSLFTSTVTCSNSTGLIFVRSKFVILEI